MENTSNNCNTTEKQREVTYRHSLVDATDVEMYFGALSVGAIVFIGGD